MAPSFTLSLGASEKNDVLFLNACACMYVGGSSCLEMNHDSWMD